jgi:molybdopterin-synthase adenylyltransferase
MDRGSVAVVGVGALGSAAALELAAAGVGAIRLVDGDRVEISNLHRQMLHATTDIGRPKAVVAAAKLARASRALRVEARAERLGPHNAAALLADVDVVIDGTDDVATKYLMNDLCVRAGTPLVHAGVVGFAGQVLTILPGEGPCLRCLFPEPPADEETAGCRDAGVLGPAAAVVGALEARVAVEILAGVATPRLLRFDARALALRTTFPRRSPACPACAGAALSSSGPRGAESHAKEMS